MVKMDTRLINGEMDTFIPKMIHTFGRASEMDPLAQRSRRAPLPTSGPATEIAGYAPLAWATNIKWDQKLRQNGIKMHQKNKILVQFEARVPRGQSLYKDDFRGAGCQIIGSATHFWTCQQVCWIFLEESGWAGLN